MFFRGEKAEEIPVIHGHTGRPQVDSRQLRRWNITESTLPAGTLILYRRPTVWEHYQRYIVAGVVLIVVQALLIAGLIWQSARRMSATQALEKLGGRMIHAQEEERARIARELHDDFSQRLAVQCIELVQLRKNLPESEVEERSRALKILKGTKEISADMRALSHQLHSSRLELVGLEPALSGLCEEITKQCNIEVRFVEPESPLNLPKSVELCLFRVAQEALGNVVKHSHAGSAHVELSPGRNGVSLRISDSGKGFGHNMRNPGEGIGLISMRERLRLVGGRLSVRSELVGGTEILAEIPLWISANEEHVTTHADVGMES
jgi:signal transduction histidine kinase